MLKLIYHNAVFGPIDLEYDRPVIRVGRNEDNELVLRHPSIEPYHCVLVFRGEKVLCLPADGSVCEQTDLGGLRGPEFGVGDQLRIGELAFTLAHSSNTVAIPTAYPRDAAGNVESKPSAAAGGRKEAVGPVYFCPNCRTFIPEAEVKRVGLVGHTKRNLCPRCSRALEAQAEPEPEPPKPAPVPKKGWWQGIGVFMTL